MKKQWQFYDSLYETLIKSAEKYMSVKIDLEEKNMTVDKTKRFIVDGTKMYGFPAINESDLQDIGIENCLEDPWEVIKTLYTRYKHSMIRKDLRYKPYFKALKVDELSDEDFIGGEDRYIARARLEGYIMLASLNGNLKWQNEDHWFWQDEEDKDLVVLKNWLFN